MLNAFEQYFKLPRSEFFSVFFLLYFLFTIFIFSSFGSFNFSIYSYFLFSFLLIFFSLIYITNIPFLTLYYITTFFTSKNVENRILTQAVLNHSVETPKDTVECTLAEIGEVRLKTSDDDVCHGILSDVDEVSCETTDRMKIHLSDHNACRAIPTISGMFVRASGPHECLPNC